MFLEIEMDERRIISPAIRGFNGFLKSCFLKAVLYRPIFVESTLVKPLLVYCRNAGNATSRTALHSGLGTVTASPFPGWQVRSPVSTQPNIAH
jgi:hypothetical protein